MQPGPHANASFVVSDDSVVQRTTLAETLRGAGYGRVLLARDGEEMQRLVEDHKPSVVITKSRLPKVSGMDFTRALRAGRAGAPRSTPVILTTTTPTPAFLAIAQSAGVDEILAFPFTGAALLQRLAAVLDHRRRFVESATYVGPCRRRRAMEDYAGPFRRMEDEAILGSAVFLWETEENRAVTRARVAALRAVFKKIAAGQMGALKELAMEAGAFVEAARRLGDEGGMEIAASLQRCVEAVGASGDADISVLATHVDALQALAALGGGDAEQRAALVSGLTKLVSKKLGLAA